MSKFCTNCGSPLKDGKCEKCDKEKETKTSKKEESKEVVEVGSNEMVNGFKDILKNIFKKPVATIKKYSTEANMNFGLVAMGINAVAMGLLVHVLLNNILKIAGLTMATINQALGEIQPYLQMFGITIDTNFGLKAGIAMAVLSAIMVGVIYVMGNMVFKKTMDYKKIIATVGVSETFLTIAALGAIVLSYVNVAIALIFFLVVAMFSVVTLYQSIGETTDLESNEIIYTTGAAITIPVIAITIVLLVMMVLYVGMAATVTYVHAASRY
ncbi:MAG: zinc ribbon domain-containing protein [Bacilli bacterium]|nr:zinc ribbon domain-containing protein [Bacilli bacterium]